MLRLIRLIRLIRLSGCPGGCQRFLGAGLSPADSVCKGLPCLGYANQPDFPGPPFRPAVHGRRVAGQGELERPDIGGGPSVCLGDGTVCHTNHDAGGVRQLRGRPPDACAASVWGPARPYLGTVVNLYSLSSGKASVMASTRSIVD
jgi:hypothetical protein